jgi:hypothetical protein
LIAVVRLEPESNIALPERMRACSVLALCIKPFTAFLIPGPALKDGNLRQSEYLAQFVPIVCMMQTFNARLLRMGN